MRSIMVITATAVALGIVAAASAQADEGRTRMDSLGRIVADESNIPTIMGEVASGLGHTPVNAGITEGYQQDALGRRVPSASNFPTGSAYASAPKASEAEAAGYTPAQPAGAFRGANPFEIAN